MHSPPTRRLALGLCLAPLLTPVLLAQLPAARKAFTGKVVPLAGVVEKAGIRLDPEASPHWLALVTDDGKTYPLIRDSGSQMFYKDPVLLNRPMQITGQLFRDTALLQVLDVRSVKNGKLHEVYYWCAICAIRRNYKMMCECCGGPMELTEALVP